MKMVNYSNEWLLVTNKLIKLIFEILSHRARWKLSRNLMCGVTLEMKRIPIVLLGQKNRGHCPEKPEITEF